MFRRWTPQREAVVIGLVVLALLIAAMLHDGAHIGGRRGIAPALCRFSAHEGLGCAPEPRRSR